MSFSYQPLWNLLAEQNISKMDFAKKIDISNTTLAKLSKNEPITLTTIDKICNAFNCKVEDVVEHIPDIETLQKNNTNLEIGTVFLSKAFPPRPNAVHPDIPYAVVKIDTLRNGATRYYIAPFTTRERNLMLLHSDLLAYTEFDMFQWIDLAMTRTLFYNQPVKIINKLPNSLINKINSFFSAVSELSNIH